MARKVVPLTNAVIRTAKPGEKTWKLFDGGGLYLEVTPSGGKLWRFKYRFGGKEKLLALGRWPETSLSAARRKRAEARELLARGIDPSKARKAETVLQKALVESAPELAAPAVMQAVSRVIHALAEELAESGALPHLPQTRSVRWRLYFANRAPVEIVCWPSASRDEVLANWSDVVAAEPVY